MLKWFVDSLELKLTVVKVSPPAFSENCNRYLDMDTGMKTICRLWSGDNHKIMAFCLYIPYLPLILLQLQQLWMVIHIVIEKGVAQYTLMTWAAQEQRVHFWTVDIIKIKLGSMIVLIVKMLEWSAHVNSSIILPNIYWYTIYIHYLSLQLQVAHMAVFVYLVVWYQLREGLRCAWMECGVLFVTQAGTTRMHLLSAGNWDILLQV